MSTSPFQLHGRVSRRDLATNPLVWATLTVIYGIVGIATAVIPVLWPSQYAEARLWPYAGLLFAAALIPLFVKPARIGAWGDHAVMFSIPVITAIGVFVYAPTGFVPLAAAMFAGTFSAGRLESRKQLLAHHALYSVILVLPVLFVHVDP